MQEPKSKNLKMPPLPKMIGELLHSNQTLKVFSIAAIALVIMTLVVMFVMATREPVVITLEPNGQLISRAASLPKAEDQIREGVKSYLEKRYQWEPKNVIKNLKESENFITPQSLKAFQSAISNVVKFSTEKIVSQRVYPEKIEVNLLKKTAYITGDRVTTIQGLKAAGNLKLELSFESGPRTQANPWGIYISKEREE